MITVYNLSILSLKIKFISELMKSTKIFFNIINVTDAIINAIVVPSGLVVSFGCRLSEVYKKPLERGKLQGVSRKTLKREV